MIHLAVAGTNVMTPGCVNTLKLFETNVPGTIQYSPTSLEGITFIGTSVISPVVIPAKNIQDLPQ